MTNFEKLVRDVKVCQNLITGIRNYRNLLEKQDLTKTEKDSLKDDIDFKIDLLFDNISMLLENLGQK